MNDEEKLQKRQKMVDELKKIVELDKLIKEVIDDPFIISKLFLENNRRFLKICSQEDF